MIDPKFAITPAYDILLRGSADIPIGLYHLGLATVKQLTRLHYSINSEKAVGKKLRKLADNGYVQIDSIPTKLAKSPYYYALGRKGVSHLKQAGMDFETSYRPIKGIDKSYLFLMHTQDLNDIIISAALLKKQAPDYRLDYFIPERALKRSPYEVTYQGKAYSLIPDTYLDFRAGKMRFPVIIEHDRDTEGRESFKKKIKAYIVFLKNEGYRRLGRLREWTWQELQGENLSSVFFFTCLEKTIDPLKLWLAPSWYTLEDNKPVSLLGV
jgi:hypothetical protein